MTVLYRLERTGVGDQRRERLLTAACPDCGADWTSGRVGLPRPGGHRSYWCTACDGLFDAVLDDESAPPALG